MRGIQARALTVLGQRLLELLLLFLRQRAECRRVLHLGFHLLHCKADTQQSTSAVLLDSNAVQKRISQQRHADCMLPVTAML